MDATVDFFVHIPKTAGTTLLHIIEEQYSAAATLSSRGVALSGRRALLEAMPDHIRVVAGHFHFGMRRFFPRPCRAFTMLRDPVDRLLSAYYFIARSAEKPNHQALRRGELTMEKLARRQGAVQARFIAGYGPMEEVAPEVLLREAKENLASNMAAFGLTEHFDASLLLFNEALGWQVNGYVRENVTRDRPALQAREPGELEMIRNHCAVDVELYGFAKELFGQRLAAQPPGFEERLAALRANVKVRERLGRVRTGWNFLRRKLGMPGQG